MPAAPVAASVVSGPGAVRRRPGRRPALLAAAALLALSFATGPGGSTRAGAAAQPDVTDRQLERASRRTVDVRLTASGRRVSMPIEVYVSRVIAGEGEPDAADAAPQALAIAIRTYAITNARKHAAEGFGLCDTTHCQVPRPSTPASRRAALATAGRILTYDGAPAEIFYSASCGGRTERAPHVWPRIDFPYLQSVADDVHEDEVPWQLETTLADLERRLRTAGYGGGPLRDVAVDAVSESGRAVRLRLTGLEPDVMDGAPFRMAVGPTVLRSTAFTVARQDEAVRFVGRGYGHGVGLCVVGAGRRAARGESADEILRTYFPGLAISTLRDGAR